MQSFPRWLEHRHEVPDIANLTRLIAQSSGVSRQSLEKVLNISPDVLDDLLRALITSGQVVVVSVGGRMVYKAVG